MSGAPSHRLPGDPAPVARIARMLRVDHAGEFGATRIYDGQLAVLSRGPAAAEIRRMAEAEARHLARFETLVAERRVRPSVLHPLWSLAGLALGSGTALLGARAAMACTVAVEEVIDEHYRDQAEYLAAEDPALGETVRAFRDDELAHRAAAIAYGAETTPGYAVLSGAIKAGSRLAIWLASRM